jgi:hypothetical protein
MNPPRPPKPSSNRSHDDLSAVAELDAAEERARAALRLAESEATRVAELEAVLDTLRAQDPPKQKPAPAEDKVLSVSPERVTFHGRRWKIIIPTALFIALGPLTWDVVTDYLETKRQLRKMLDTFGEQAKRIEEVDHHVAEVSKSNAELRETVAQLSGYLAGVLPKAGVRVPGAQPGATPIDVVSDPLPVGDKRPRPVNVRTLVPAPAPR